MDRRKQNRTDESAKSGSSVSDSLKSLVMGTSGSSVGYYMFGDEEMRNADPKVILRRMLSTKSAISTHSALAEANRRARDDKSKQVFTCIGQGQCGTVFALKGTTTVIKIANSPAKEDELYNDCQKHKLVYEAFATIASVRKNIHIPPHYMWVTPSSAHFWGPKESLFPSDARTPNYGLISERVFPLPLPVREAIVDELCPKAIRDNKNAFLKRPENQDCLVRIYLGRRQDTRKSEQRTVRLRNFPLHVDEMERIQLDTVSYARTMAETLAVLHWRAGVDGNDIEFIFGSTPTPTIIGGLTAQELSVLDKDEAGEHYSSDFEHRTISLWLLDFNQCKNFTHDSAGVKKLVEGFWFNDPYYPRPNATHDNDKKLWEVFSTHYLQVSAELTDVPGPRHFIEGVIKKGSERSGNLFG